MLQSLNTYLENVYTLYPKRALKCLREITLLQDPTLVSKSQNIITLTLDLSVQYRLTLTKLKNNFLEFK